MERASTKDYIVNSALLVLSVFFTVLYSISLTLKAPVTIIVVCFVIHLFVILKVIFANSVDPDQTAPDQSDQGPHCLPVCKNRFESLQEYSADDINRRHFQMQFFLAL